MSSTAPAFALAGVPRVNLMPPLEIERRKRGSLVRVWAWVVVAAMLVAALVVAGAFALKFVADQALVAEQAETTVLLSELASLSPVSSAIATEAELTDFRADAMGADFAWAPVVATVAGALPGDVRLTGFDFTAGGIPQTDDPRTEVGLTGHDDPREPQPDRSPGDDPPAARTRVGRCPSTVARSLTGTAECRHLQLPARDRVRSVDLLGSVRRDGRSRVMSRSIINILGVVATLGVLALGILLVAMPLGFQALGVFGQTATVLGTNTSYQAQIDALREEEEHLDETQASVAGLQTQITPANELDDVFEVIAQGGRGDGRHDHVGHGRRARRLRRAHVARRRSARSSRPPPQPPAPRTRPTRRRPTRRRMPRRRMLRPPRRMRPPASTGRTQVDFTIAVTAGDLDQVTAFLDALRGGPRLLGQVQTTVTSTGTGFDVTVTALTFVLPQEG